jgi:Spy/CpxP family protein refolding chaperone
MFKVAAVGVTALVVAASPFAYAQNNSAGNQGHLSATEPNSLTDLRIETVKDALQLTSDQQQYWPAIENAIRTRAKHRAARLEDLANRASELHDSDPVDLALNRNPVDFMHRRAEALAQRSADLKTLADAWQPLYQVLSPDQKQRMALLRMTVLGEVVNRVRGPGGQFYDYEEEQ